MIEDIRLAGLQASGQDEAGERFHAYSDEVFWFRESRTSDLRETFYRPALCMILQGAKQTIIDEKVLHIAAGDAVIISHHVPVQARITRASPDEPYLALIVKIDTGIMRDLAEKIDRLEDTSAAACCVASHEADLPLVEAVGRLLTVLRDPLEAEVMGEAAYREVHLRMLQATHGAMLRRMASGGDVANGVARAIQFMRENYAEDLSVPEVCRQARMSESSFYTKFRDVTGTTPSRYLKSLRLQEAHGLLSLRGHSVSDAAFAVGYESVSHFSRDYKQAFGVSPKEAKSTATTRA
ncbi:MAG: AraC family transcriptional regulator [Planctomycetota bacterium]